MDVNVYALEKQVAMRLEAARAYSAHASLLASLRPRRVGTLALLGLALIRLGRFIERRGGGRRRLARTVSIHPLPIRHV